MYQIIGKVELKMLDRKRCDQLVEKAKKINEAPIMNNHIIVNLEQILNVKLPEDFKYIVTNYHYEYIFFFSFYHLGDEVIEETSYYRANYNLRNEYIILSKQDDVSFLILKTKSLEESEVIWCAYQDFFNLCDGQPMQYNPTIFPSFTDFFEFLIDEEEKMQAEDRALEDKAAKE
jgi:hypothetical protein